MSLPALPRFTPFTLAQEEGVPTLRLAQLNLGGAPVGLHPIPLIVAHTVYCLEAVKQPEVKPGGLTIAEMGRGVLDTACTIYAVPALGAPDEDRRKARSFVRFDQDWAAYLHAALEAAPGAPEKIVCPLSIPADRDEHIAMRTVERAVERLVERMLHNDFFAAPFVCGSDQGVR
jgi:hypothetical protein